MAFITADFVKETSTFTGLGAILLAGARAPARTFSSVCANGDTVHYAVSNTSINEWEVGLGTYNTGANSITRTTVLSSSNGGAAVNFGVGTKFVDLVLPTTRIASFKTTLPLVSHVGGNSVSDLSTLAFENASNVTFSLSTGANAATVLASVAAGGGGGVGLSAGTQSVSTGTVVFSDSNGVSFGMSGSSRVTAAYDRELSVLTVIGVGATSKGSLRLLAFEDSNGVSWRVAGAGSSLTLRGSIASELGLVSHVGGNTVGGVTRVAFQNASNVTWSLSTAASAATVLASVAGETPFGVSAGTQSVSTGTLVFSDSNGVSFGMSGSSRITVSVVALKSFSLNNFVHGTMSDLTVSSGVTNGAFFLNRGANTADTIVSLANVTARFSSDSAHLFAHQIAGGSNGLSNVAAISFTNANGVTFGGVTTSLVNVGRVMQITASVGAGGAAGSISAGTTSVALGQAVFSDSNNVSFGLNGSTVTASAGFGLLSHVGGQSINGATRLAFSNASNVTWSLSTAAGAATLLASVDPNPAALAVSAAGASASAGTVVWSNSNNVSFGQAGSIITATATVAATRDIGIVSHIGGNVVSSVSQLAFSNASNVTWSLSTAANAATVIASVAAAGGGMTFSGIDPIPGGMIIENQYGQNSLAVHPVTFPNVQFDRFAMPIKISNGSSTSLVATISVSFRLGLYSSNASTLSLMHSMSATTSFNVSSSNNSSLYTGLRYITLPWTTTITQGQYWYGFVSSTASAGAALAMRNGMVSQSVNDFAGYLGSSNASLQVRLGNGFFSATTGALPASVAFSQLRIAATNTASSMAFRAPCLFFHSGTA